jgi:hypothetical protein
MAMPPIPKPSLELDGYKLSMLSMDEFIEALKKTPAEQASSGIFIPLDVSGSMGDYCSICGKIGCSHVNPPIKSKLDSLTFGEKKYSFFIKNKIMEKSFFDLKKEKFKKLYIGEPYIGESKPKLYDPANPEFKDSLAAISQFLAQYPKIKPAKIKTSGPNPIVIDGVLIPLATVDEIRRELGE